MKEREAWVKVACLVRNHYWKGCDALRGHLEDQTNAARESMMMAGLVMLYRYGVVLKNPMPPMILRERASIAFHFLATRLFLEGEKGQGTMRWMLERQKKDKRRSLQDGGSVAWGMGKRSLEG